MTDKNQLFSSLIEKELPMLRRVAYRVLGNPDDTDEAVQEALLKAWAARASLRQPEYFKTWLTRILINVCNAELRRRRREVAMAELPETAQEVFDALPLRDAVARLPRDLRAVIILRYFDGLTLAQTAETLQIPQGTVATRQRKALSLLRLELTDSEEVGA